MKRFYCIVDRIRIPSGSHVFIAIRQSPAMLSGLLSYDRGLL